MMLNYFMGGVYVVLMASCTCNVLTVKRNKKNNKKNFYFIFNCGFNYAWYYYLFWLLLNQYLRIERMDQCLLIYFHPFYKREKKNCIQFFLFNKKWLTPSERRSSWQATGLDALLRTWTETIVNSGARRNGKGKGWTPECAFIGSLSLPLLLLRSAQMTHEHLKSCAEPN